MAVAAAKHADMDGFAVGECGCERSTEKETDVCIWKGNVKYQG